MLSEERSMKDPGDHMHVIFVGDKPSKKNLNPNIPFVGTKSYLTLLSWIGRMNINTFNMKIINSTQQSADLEIRGYAVSGGAIIALGENAAKFIESLGIKDYFKLPHPSGLNRQINNKTELKNKLQECSNYVYSK